MSKYIKHLQAKIGGDLPNLVEEDGSGVRSKWKLYFSEDEAINRKQLYFSRTCFSSSFKISNSFWKEVGEEPLKRVTSEIKKGQKGISGPFFIFWSPDLRPKIIQNFSIPQLNQHMRQTSSFWYYYYSKLFSSGSSSLVKLDYLGIYKSNYVTNFLTF